MGDSQTLGQRKNQYRVRFYRNRAEDLPEVRPGTNVLSAIKDYFNEAGGKESPGFSRSSFLADSITNTPDSIPRKQVSSSNPHISTLTRLQSIGKINETKMKASPAVSEKIKTPNNIIMVNVVSEEEMEDCESDMPLNLVVEREKESEIVLPVSNLIRNRFYSSDNSVVQTPPSPASKSSTQKRLCFGDAVLKDKASFASVFASRYKRSSTDDDSTMQMSESVKTDPRPNTTASECVAKRDDEEFVIEDEHGINMSFSSINKRSSFGSSRETRSIASSSAPGNQKLQRKVSAVFQGRSAFRLSMGGQPALKESSPNVNRNASNEESKNISNSGRSKETMMAPPSAVDESQKSKAVSEQLLPLSKTIQQTQETSKELELTDEDNLNQIMDSNSESIKVSRTLKLKAARTQSSNAPEESQKLVVKSNIDVEAEQSLANSKTAQQTRQTSNELELDEVLDTNRAKVKIPGTTKPKAARPKSSCVSYQTLEIEPAEPVPEQSTVRSQTGKNTLTYDRRNKAKYTLHKDKNSFTSHLVQIENIEPPIKRMDTDYSDLPVLAEDEEFVINDITDFCSDAKSNWNKKPQNIPKDRKKNKKKEENVPTEVLNVTYTSARQSDDVTDSRKSQNDSTDSSSLNDKKRRKSRPTEIDKLVLQKYVQADVDNQNEGTPLRRKRTSAPPSTWWVVKQAERNTTFEIEDELPQNSPKSNRKAAESIDPLEWQSNKEESFELKERSPLDQNEQFLKESNEKSSETLTPRKRTKKLKHVESEKTTVPTKVKRQKKNKTPKKTRSPAKKSKKSKKQQEIKTQESDYARSQEHNLNVCDLPNETDHLAAAAKPATPAVSEPHCPPQRHKTTSDECSKKSPASGSTEEREPHRLPRQSFTSPVYDSANLSFQSGPVLKTRAVQHNSETDAVVRNLTCAESLKAVDPLPISDPDTNQDALADCIYHASNDGQDNPPPNTMCFNNHYFSAGKCMLKPMEQEGRDAPIFDILVFYIVRGKIMLKLHKSYHRLKGGDFFYIPPNNTFHIQNIDTDVAELIFTELKPGSI